MTTQQNNETCPPDPIRDGTQQDLNAPVVPQVGDTAVYVQAHMGDLVDLCKWGLSESIIKGVLMQFLANHFSDARMIMMPSLKTYLWKPDQVDSGIRISTNTGFDPDSGKLPAIVLKRKAKQSIRKVMGDLRGTDDEEEAHDGIQTYVRFVTGGHRLFCMAATDGATEDLGDEVFDALTFMSPVFRQALPFHDFEVVGMDELGVMDDLGNRTGVAIDVAYTYEIGWGIKPLAPRIKTLNLDVKPRT